MVTSTIDHRGTSVNIQTNIAEREKTRQHKSNLVIFRSPFMSARKKTEAEIIHMSPVIQDPGPPELTTCPANAMALNKAQMSHENACGFVSPRIV